MSRNDARAQRALAVSRMMKGERNGIRAALERAVTASQPRVARVSPEVQAARSAAELSAFARRLSPSDLQTIDALHSRGGWPAVRDALAQAGLSSDALAAAGSVVKRDGFQALGHAVTQQIAREDSEQIQAAVAPEAAKVLASLSPADLAEAERIYAEGGPEALAARAMALGLHPAVAAVAVRTLETHGTEGAQRVAVAHLQHAEAHAAEEAASQRTVDEWTPKDSDPANIRSVKEASPIASMLRSPAFHAAAPGIAKRLTAQGLEKPAGVSTAQWVMECLVRLDGGHVMDGERRPFEPSLTPEQRLATVTEILGGTDPGAVSKFLDTIETARVGHRVALRFAESDARRPSRPATAAAPTNELRATLEKATAKHGGKPERIAVGNALQATIAVSAGYGPKDLEALTTHADRDVERMASRIERPAPRPESSVRAALEHAVEVHSNDEDEERETDE
jgi:hypothetical protein